MKHRAASCRVRSLRADPFGNLSSAVPDSRLTDNPPPIINVALTLIKGAAAMRSAVVAIVLLSAPPALAQACDPNYGMACVPVASDVDCAGGSGNGPAYVRGPVSVVGRDIYKLDRDKDGYGCEPPGWTPASLRTGG